MARDNYRDLEGAGDGTPKETRTCLPLGLIKSSLGSLSRCWRPEQDGRPDPFEKKYVHTPTHAASSFLKTTTTRDIQRANEIL
ncbi:hypothetical protein C8A01DRAFT_14722 [Parachaetomium inaequale]|uniref:Uncharacterized protein n=1 Tax=Parachaetomium inaequale TaxID=2588326 RepID=A0AAN6PMG3_9PEZI|nr:hypothetical protein C8A01DRAFT_14722 [Parachaetomium inaequale]